MLRTLVSWSYDRRRRVVVLWIAALVAAFVLAGVAGGNTKTDFTVPGSDSAAAMKLLQQRFPRFAGGTVDVVYTAADGITGPDTAARMDALARNIAAVDHVVSAERGPVSPDGSTGMVQVRFDVAAEQLPAESVQRVDGPRRPGRRRRAADRARRLSNREGRTQRVRLRAGRPGRGAAHPAGRVRLRARRRATAPRRRVRPRRGARPRRGCTFNVFGRPRLRGADRDDDRYRRRHRLRPVHRDPLPVGASPGPTRHAERWSSRDPRPVERSSSPAAPS